MNVFKKIVEHRFWDPIFEIIAAIIFFVSIIVALLAPALLLNKIVKSDTYNVGDFFVLALLGFSAIYVIKKLAPLLIDVVAKYKRNLVN